MSDEKRKPSQQFQSATSLLRDALENAQTPIATEFDWHSIKVQCYNDIIQAITTNDMMYLHRAIDSMVRQTSVKDVAQDLIKCKTLMKQYGP